MKRLFVIIISSLLSFIVGGFLKAAEVSYLINFYGIEGKELENVESWISNFQKRSYPQIDSDNIEKFSNSISFEIKKALQPFGYFQADVLSKIKKSPERWELNYEVSLREQIKTSEIKIDFLGNFKQIPELEKFLANFPLKENVGFSAEVYKKAKKDLLNLVISLGFLHAKIEKEEVIVDLINYKLQIFLIINLGPRFYFGNISISKTDLNRDFLLRYFVFKPGEVFTREKIIQSQNNLYRSGYFKNLIFTHIYRDNFVDIDAQLNMNKRNLYKFGIGYGSEDRARVTFGYNLRMVNERGDKFGTELILGKKQKQAALRYTILGSDPLHENYSLNSFISRLEPADSESILYSIGVDYIYYQPRMQASIQLNYQSEKYRFTNNDPFKKSRILAPSISLSLLNRDKVVYVDSGGRVTFNLQGSFEPISTVNYLQGEVNAKIIKKFWQENRWILRGEGGYTIVDDLKKLPVSKQFYIGGTTSLRGYGWNDLGPGKYKLLFSLEYQRQVKKNWYAAIFYDCGNVFNDSNFKLREGIGVGVIWQTGLGSLQVYVGLPLDDLESNPQLAISFGSEL